MEELAQKYVDFHNDVKNDENLDQTINILFLPTFRRIVNGRTVVSSRKNLSSQLQQMEVLFGKRQLKLQHIINCADHEQCLLRYLLDVENMGQFEVMAILKSKSGIQIDEVDEIFYKVEEA